MSDPHTIPPSMIEAAAKAHAEHLGTVVAYGSIENPRNGWQCSCDAGRRTRDGLLPWTDAADEVHAHCAQAALVAALSTCTVREEWRAQITYPAGDEGHTMWWPARRSAELYIETRKDIFPDYTYTLQRRLVIETPGEDV